MTIEIEVARPYTLNTPTKKLTVTLASASEPAIKPFDWLLILGVALSWGLAFVAIKETARMATPFQAAGIRFFLATLPLLFIALKKSKLRQWQPRDFAKLAVLGFIQTSLVFGIIYSASRFVPSSIIAIIANTNPFFVAIMAHFVIAGEKLTKAKIIGLLIGFIGVVVLVSGSFANGFDNLLGPALLLVAAVLWAVSSVLVKKFGFTDMASVTCWQMLFGSLPLLLIGFGIDNQPINLNWSFVVWTVYVAFVASTFGWWAWYMLLQRYKASRVSVFLFLVPVCGVTSGVVLMGDSLSYNLLLGGGLVVLGVITVNLRRQRLPKESGETAV